MDTYNILVVDDNYEEVKELYDSFLNSDDFIISVIRTKSELSSAKFADYDVILLDVNLDNWHIGLKEACRFIGKSAPVILVSREMSGIDGKKTEDRIKRELSNTPEVKVIQSFDLRLLHYGEFEEREQTAIVYQTLIRVAISCFSDVNSRPIQVDDSQTINILHISDLQYGDKNTDDWSRFVEQTIGVFLREVVPEVHLIVISGDIAFSGLENEYNLAKKGLSSLCKSLWGKDELQYRNRIIMVPGNHDLDYRYASIPELQLDFSESKDKDIVKVSHSSNADSKEVQAEASHLAFLPFRRFAFDFYNDARWLTEDSLNWLDERFNYLGVRFALTNTAEQINCNRMSVANLLEESATKIVNELFENNESDLFTILVSHHGSEDPEFGREDSIQEWPNMSNMIRVIKCNLWLHGHGHRNLILMQEYGDSTKESAKDLLEKTQASKEHFIDSDNTFIRIMAPTTHLNQKLRPKNERKGFNIISLNRDKKSVNKITVTNFILEDRKPVRNYAKVFKYSV